MIDALRGWAAAVGCAAVAGGLALSLSPSTGMQRVLRLSLAAFFICCMMVPLMGSRPEFPTLSAGAAQVQSQEIAEKLKIVMDERIDRQAGEQIKTSLERNLQDLGINPLDVKIYIVSDNTQQDNVVIQADIKLESKYAGRHDELVTYLKNKLGISVKLGYE